MNDQINRRAFLTRSALAAAAFSVTHKNLLAAPAHTAAENLKTIAELDPVEVRRFTGILRGRSLMPDDPGYEAACRLWTGRMPKRPGLVVRCADVEDIATTVKFARDRQLLLAVRGGGHTRNATCDGGILVNLSGMRAIDVDPKNRTVRVQAGSTVGAVDETTAAHKLATVLGECPSVGISGLTLGGGLGRLMGQHGSLCDNLLSARVVTADGEVLRVSPEENRELFWAVRGGGGNFGIASEFEFRLHPAGRVLSGMLRYRISDAKEVLRFLRGFMETAPDELDALVEIGSRILQYAPDAQNPIVVVNVCCGGDLRKAEKTLRPLRTFLRPTSDTIRPMPYLEAQGLGDVSTLIRHLSPGFSGYGQSGFLAQFDDEAIDRIIAHCERPPSEAWSFALDHYMHGAVLRPSENNLAFSLRRRGYSYRTTAFEPGDTQAEAPTAWVKGLNGALAPLSGGRMYMNYLTDQGEAGVRAAFGANYDRLSELKKRFDPINLFRLNPNITPAA